MDKIFNQRHVRQKTTQGLRQWTLIGWLLVPAPCFADVDPVTKGANQFVSILFGSLGTSLCILIIGSCFLMAKLGKITWDRFLYVGLLAVGFLGTPSIVALLSQMVGR